MTNTLENLYDVSLWIIWPASIGFLVIAALVGRRLGRRDAAGGGDRAQAVGALETTALGLVTLLISFTFSAALDRYDARKALVVAEANAIDTTVQRARFLPEPHASAFRAKLAEYTEVRLSMREHPRDGLQKIIEPSLALQHELWDRGVEAAALDPRSIPHSQFVQSLSEMLDLHEKRLAADRNHVPEIVFLLLYSLAAVALVLNGYRAGLKGPGPLVAPMIVATLLASVIAQVQDLDRPQRGAITVSQQPMANVGAAPHEVR